MTPRVPRLGARVRRRGTQTASASVQRAARFVRRAWRRADPLVDLIDPERSRCLPRDFDVIENYEDRFVDTARMFDVFLDKCESVTPGRDGLPVAVVVTPWYGTPCPWFAIAVGFGLASRGRRVVFLWHDMVFPERSASFDVQNREIGRVMRRLRRRFPVLRLSEEIGDTSGRDEDAALLDRLADLNLTWYRRGSVPTEQDLQFRARMRRRLADALPKIRSVMQDNRFDYVLAPGGVAGPSGLYLAAGRAAGVRVATFDAGFGATSIDVDGVAAQHTDTLQAFDLLTEDLAGHHDAVVVAAKEEFESRRAGRDPDTYQLARPGKAPHYAERSIFIPLNVVFDTAALGLHHLFPGSREWLVETITALLDHTTDPILVRQHPAERHELERSNFDVGGILREVFHANPQVRFIPADAPVSSYDLLDACRLVLPFASTIGIEAAALGKPVIVSGSVYYGPLGFVWAPSSRQEYFDTLERGARGELPLLPDQIDRAWRCFYLISCHRVRTEFTPQPPDFWRWVTRRPDELYRDPDVDDILTSIDEAIPLSILQHRRYNPARSA